jgi:hypothetical protein
MRHPDAVRGPQRGTLGHNNAVNARAMPAAVSPGRRVPSLPVLARIQRLTTGRSPGSLGVCSSALIHTALLVIRSARAGTMKG